MVYVLSVTKGLSYPEAMFGEPSYARLFLSPLEVPAIKKKLTKRYGKCVKHQGNNHRISRWATENGFVITLNAEYENKTVRDGPRQGECVSLLDWITRKE